MAKKPQKTGIQKAVEVAGGVRPLATLTGISKSFIWDMLQRGVAAPERCYQIHEKTEVPLHELNPKVFRKAA
jgi:DNA-binding transcriptional regulator YdaS (Cro superfamily)